MTTKTKTPSTKTATNKGKVKKPASTKLKFPFPKPRKPSQLDRIEAALTGLLNNLMFRTMGCDGEHIPTPEFLSRAEVTARELGLTPVVPEPWRPKVNGLAKYGGVVSKVTDWSKGSIGDWWFISGRWVPTHKLSEPSPAEVAAHQAEIAAKEEAARTP